MVTLLREIVVDDDVFRKTWIVTGPWLRQTKPRALRGQRPSRYGSVPFGRFGLLVQVDRGGAIGVKLSRAGHREAGDFPAAIDGAGQHQRQFGVCRNESVEVCHDAFAPEERAWIKAAVHGKPDNIAAVIDGIGDAGKIAVEGAKVAHPGGFVPNKTVKSFTAV